MRARARRLRSGLAAGLVSAAAALGVMHEARAGEGEAAPDEAPAPAPRKPEDDGRRTLDLRAGWGILTHLQQHSFAFAAHVFLSRRASVGGQFEAYGDTVAYEPEKRGTDYHHGGALDFEYVLYLKQLSPGTTLEVFGDAGAGVTVTRPRTQVADEREQYSRDYTLVLGGGARVLFASRASIHLDVRDTLFPKHGIGTYLLVPRIGLGIAF